MIKMMICLSSKCHEYSNNRKRSLWILESPNRTKILFKYRPQFLRDWQKGREPEWAWPPAFFSALSFLIFSFFFSFFFASALQKFRFSGFPRVQPPTLVCTEFTSEEKALRRVRRENQRLIRVIAGISWIWVYNWGINHVQIGLQAWRGYLKTLTWSSLEQGSLVAFLLNKPLEDTIWKVW